MVNSNLIKKVYVNPVIGNDANPGSLSKPYKTLTRALQVKTSTKIKLASGTYSVENGEVFPLVVGAGVMIVGHEATKGKGVVILGSGNYQTQNFGWQNITLVLLNAASITGVTITNNVAKGTGIWIESGASVITHNTLSNCGREGVFISNNAQPRIIDNVFVQNAAAGLVMAGNSQAEVQRNFWEKNTLGIAISDFATPLIVDNKLSENQIAIALSRNAQPILRNNLIQKNTKGGLLVNGNAIPDLGNNQEPGGNVFVDNGGFDLQNTTSKQLILSGNRLHPGRIKGLVELVVEDSISGHWAAAFLQPLADKGLLNYQQPDQLITRAEYADLVVKAFKPTSKHPAIDFVDVNQDFWAYNAIQQAAKGGFVGSGRDRRFRPEENVLKIQIIVSLVNGLGLPPANEEVLFMYDDANTIGTNTRTAVASATEKRILVNYPDPKIIQPNRQATYAEVAAMVYQALVFLGQMPVINLPYIVPYTDTGK